MSLLWLFLTVVALQWFRTGIFLAHQFRVLEFSLHTSSEYWNFPCTPVQSTGIFLAHQFRVLEIFTVCSCVVGCWTNRTNMGTKLCCWSRKNVACQERQHSRCIIVVLFQENIWKQNKNIYLTLQEVSHFSGLEMLEVWVLLKTEVFRHVILCRWPNRYRHLEWWCSQQFQAWAKLNAVWKFSPRYCLCNLVKHIWSP